MSVFKQGDVVKALPGKALRSGGGSYEEAIVLSISDPFALVSMEGDMLWTCTIRPEDVTKVRDATEEEVARVQHRWPRT